MIASTDFNLALLPEPRPEGMTVQGQHATMKITKITVGASLKASKNYNSFENAVSYDIEIEEGDNVDAIRDDLTKELTGVVKKAVHRGMNPQLYDADGNLKQAATDPLAEKGGY